MIFVLFLLLLSGCASVDTPRVPQQKNMTQSAMGELSKSIEDFAWDIEDDGDDVVEDVAAQYHANFYRKVSIAACDAMNLQTVLSQMSQMADVGVVIAADVDIAAPVMISVKNRPFIDVLNDICNSSNLRYTVTGSSVMIALDSPYLQTYDIQFLNTQRNAQDSISISTDVFSSSQMSSQSSGVEKNNNQVGHCNGSNSVVSGVAQSDFWSELSNALNIIVGQQDGAYVSLHKQGGIVTVFAPQKKQQEIRKYLRLLKEAIEAQVLIEAKILEVNLNDEFKSGINWNILRDGGAMILKDFSDRAELFSAGINRQNLSVIAGLIEKFGAVKTLSSPRITVLNNQSAILKVAQNEVIYMPELQRQYATVADNRSTDFLSNTLLTIPIGLVMSVHPCIDLKNNTVVLGLRPTISKIVKYKKVPFLYTQNSATQANSTSVQCQDIPIVDVREMDSVLKLRSGQVIIMGGLMHEKSNNLRNGLPGLPEIDFLAGGREKNTDVTELVIFLKATILKKRNRAVHNADKKIYESFANDPRPLRFKQ